MVYQDRVDCPTELCRNSWSLLLLCPKHQEPGFIMNRFFRYEFSGLMTECRFLWMRQQRDPVFRANCLMTMWYVPGVLLFSMCICTFFSGFFVSMRTFWWLLAVSTGMFAGYIIISMLVITVWMAYRLATRATQCCRNTAQTWWDERGQRRDEMIKKMNAVLAADLSKDS